MAINYLNSINLNQNELIKAQIENQPNNASAGTGVEGQLYYDTTLDVLKVWAGGSDAIHVKLIAGASGPSVMRDI